MSDESCGTSPGDAIGPGLAGGALQRTPPLRLTGSLCAEIGPSYLAPAISVSRIEIGLIGLGRPPRARRKQCRRNYHLLLFPPGSPPSSRPPPFRPGSCVKCPAGGCW